MSGTTAVIIGAWIHEKHSAEKSASRPDSSEELQTAVPCNAIAACQTAATTMSDHQRETAFLRQCIHYEDTVERHNLDARLTQAQRDERCVRGAVWLMALLTALAIAGLCYSALFLAEFPQNKSHLILKVFGALGLGSIISLVAFAGFWGVHRRELDERREECRRLAARLLESRLGRPLITAVPNVRDMPEKVDSAARG